MNKFFINLKTKKAPKTYNNILMFLKGFFNYLIEINPTATHNSTWGIYTTEGIDKNYHKQKTAIASVNSYTCIHVFDWDDIEKIIKLIVAKKRIYARDCSVKEISASDVQPSNAL